MSGLLILAKHLLMCHKRYLIRTKGGRGSGGWGHQGRPKKHGGSLAGSGGLKKIGAWRGSSLSERRELAKKKKPVSAKKVGKKKPVAKDDFTTAELLKKVQQGEVPLRTAQEIVQEKKTEDKDPEVGDVQGGRKYTDVDFTTDEDIKPWNSWSNDLSDKEKIALEYYATEDKPAKNTPTYQEINSYLRGQDTEPTEVTKETIDVLRGALNKGSVPEDTIVFRGLPENLIDDLNVGETLIDKGFVSTSLDATKAEDFAKEFGNTKAEIRVPKGTKGGYLDSSLSAEFRNRQGIGFERELLLHSNTEFRIVSKEPLVMEVIN